jgi:hypothetical protein
MTVFRDFVLASLDPPSVWQFYPALEAAAAKQKAAPLAPATCTRPAVRDFRPRHHPA